MQPATRAGGATTAGTGAARAAPSGGPTRLDLLALARRRFLEGERLDMQAMSTELGVSRTTVYRWAGNHDQLLGEVLSQLSDETFHQAEQGVRQSGRARVIAIFTNHLRYVANSQPVRTALLRDPRQFLRVVTRDGPVGRSMAKLCEELLRREIERGTLHLQADVAAVASAMVRVGEAALYADLLAGEEPDIERSTEILELLLTPSPSRG